MTKSNFKRVD